MPLIDLAIASRADASIGNVTYTFDVNLSDTDALTAATDLRHCNSCYRCWYWN